MEKRLILFLTGFFGYGLIEVLWRGHTHWTMAIAGGLCLLMLARADELLAARVPKPVLWAIGGVGVTAVELAFGAVVNLRLGWNVWDYSGAPLNFRGQICLPYTLLWVALMIPVLPLERALRRRLAQKRA